MTSVPDPVMSVDEAIEIVARQALANVAVNHIEWEDYPDIGEDDFFAVQRRADDIASAPPHETFRAAYKVLEDRAKEFEDD